MPDEFAEISAEGVTVPISGEPEMTPGPCPEPEVRFEDIWKFADSTGVPYTNEDEAKLTASLGPPPTPRFLAEAGVGMAYLNRLTELLMVPYPGSIRVRPNCDYSGRFHDLAEVVHCTLSAHRMVLTTIPALPDGPEHNYCVEDLIKSIDVYTSGISRVVPEIEMLKEPLGKFLQLRRDLVNYPSLNLSEVPDFDFADSEQPAVRQDPPKNEGQPIPSDPLDDLEELIQKLETDLENAEAEFNAYYLGPNPKSTVIDGTADVDKKLASLYLQLKTATAKRRALEDARFKEEMRQNGCTDDVIDYNLETLWSTKPSSPGYIRSKWDKRGPIPKYPGVKAFDVPFFRGEEPVPEKPTPTLWRLLTPLAKAYLAVGGATSGVRVKSVTIRNTTADRIRKSWFNLTAAWTGVLTYLEEQKRAANPRHVGIPRPIKIHSSR